eukprot:gene8494-11515_t
MKYYAVGTSLTLFFSLIFINGKTQDLEQRHPSKRAKENFDFNWAFHKGDIAMKQVVRVGQGGITDTNVPFVAKKDTVIDYTNFKSSGFIFPADWQAVNLPHDWCIEGTFVDDNTLGSQPGGNGYLPVGIGFYRKEFEIPESDKGRNISIEFDGIFRNSTVWVNGHLLGTHLSGYTPSNYDLSDFLRYGNDGKNVILVKVGATQPEGWWYEGCGIYRHVWLKALSPLHLAQWGNFITTSDVASNAANVNIKTKVLNDWGTLQNAK